MPRPFLCCAGLALVVVVCACDDATESPGQDDVTSDVVADGTPNDLVDSAEDTVPDEIADQAEDTVPDELADLIEDTGPVRSAITIVMPVSGGGVATSTGYECRLSIGGYPMSTTHGSGYSARIGAGAVLNQ